MLSTVIGELLPLSLAIAISPLTIVAVTLMLLAPGARRTGPAFLIGWVLGTTVPVVVFALIATSLPQPSDQGGPNVTHAVVQFILALLLLLLAAQQWRSRPPRDGKPELPKWMAAIDSFTFGRALGLGVLLSLPRPKNLITAASAGIIIGGSGLRPDESAIAAGVFVLCAVSTVLIPVAAHSVAADRLRRPLEHLREWLVRENTVITAVLLTVIGVLVLGKALGSL